MLERFPVKLFSVDADIKFRIESSAKPPKTAGWRRKEVWIEHMRTWILLICLFACRLLLVAQTGTHPPAAPLPDAPSLLRTTPSSVAPDQGTTTESFFKPLVIASDQNVPRYKTANRKFWIHQALAGGLSIADAELSLYCISKGLCTEGNPLYGKHPSRARVYGTIIPLRLVLFGLTYHTKKVAPRRRIWLVFPIAEEVLHSAAITRAIVAISR
jgi:hypothetical protein